MVRFRLLFSSSLCALAASGLFVMHASAASGDSAPSGTGAVQADETGTGSTQTPVSGTGAVEFEQKSDTNMFGKWTLLKPDSTSETGGQTIRLFPRLPSGRYTLFLEPPKGTRASVRLYRGTELLQHVERPQLTFNLSGDETLRIVVHYPLTRSGDVSVNSDPPGLVFALSGPNGLFETGITPASFDNVPEGQYTVEFEALEGCVVPAAKSNKLIKGSRVSFSIRMSCAAADALRSQKQETKEKFVTIMADGEEIAFTDTPQSSWFARHVFNVAKWGILSGYRDLRGKLTGLFGPERNVTVAELAKIAHKVAGIDEREAAAASRNGAVTDQWFAPFFASAEHRGWTIYDDGSIAPERDATRAEVVVTIVQALNVPVRWQTGGVFTDVTVHTRHAAAIETAAGDGIVSGRKKEDGIDAGLFDPDAPIKRAELAKVIDLAVQKYRTVAGGAE